MCVSSVYCFIILIPRSPNKKGSSAIAGSLNISHAVALVLYERQRQLMAADGRWISNDVTIHWDDKIYIIYSCY